MSELVPVSLNKTDNRELQICWSDGVEQTVVISVLRKACQCATCMEKNKASNEPAEKGVLKVLSVAETKPLDIVGMQPAGNYAYSIQFSDGHTSGLFTLELLRSLLEH